VSIAGMNGFPDLLRGFILCNARDVKNTSIKKCGVGIVVIRGIP